MVTGEWTGTMNLTESQAGSDVGALRTRAVPSPEGDGSWRISGQKIFITYGEHDMTENIVHLVLARVPDAPPGTKGISCFIVPKRLVNDDGSLGARQPCALHRHRAQDGHPRVADVHARVRRRGRLPHRRTERRHATDVHDDEHRSSLRRVCPAWRSASAPYQQALDYAIERRQGRAVGAPGGTSSPIIDHADVRRMLLTMRSLVEAMRGLVYANAEAVDLARHAGRRRGARARPGARRAADADHESVVHRHGHRGRVARDPGSRRDGVHRGDRYRAALPRHPHRCDLRGHERHPGHGSRRPEAAHARRRCRRRLPARARVRRPRVDDAWPAAVAALREATTWILTHGAAEPNDALAAATPYLRMFGIVAGGWVMARQAIAARTARPRREAHDGALLPARAAARRRPGLLPAVTAGPDILFELGPGPTRLPPLTGSLVELRVVVAPRAGHAHQHSVRGAVWSR